MVQHIEQLREEPPTNIIKPFRNPRYGCRQNVHPAFPVEN
jgi:hypothetical protein